MKNKQFLANLEENGKQVIENFGKFKKNEKK